MTFSLTVYSYGVHVSWIIFIELAPQNINDYCFLFSYPDRNDVSNLLAARFANDSGAVVAYQLQVPNQPIIFRVSVNKSKTNP